MADFYVNINPEKQRYLSMRTLLFLLPLTFLTAYTCFREKTVPDFSAATSTRISPDSLLYQRFAVPPGFERLPVAPNSFAQYLRHLPLKPPGSKVHLYDGREKANAGVYAAVVDLPIGQKNLHQCADAVIRLRAEYLWRTGQFDQIHFNLTNGFRVDYNRWRKGERVKVVGNQTSWEQKTTPSNTYATFWAYLEFVFTYAGTLSLSKELPSVPLSTLQIGDVFIQGGSPGHAIIVVDIAINKAGKKVFLLAQSYMPAQEIQILKNPQNADLSPWYSENFGEILPTPEWTFAARDLKRFP